jgi:hypothetical protein
VHHPEDSAASRALGDNSQANPRIQKQHKRGTYLEVVIISIPA